MCACDSARAYTHECVVRVVHVSLSVCLSLYLFVCLSVCMSVSLCPCICLCPCVCVSSCLCLRLCASVCSCVRLDVCTCSCVVPCLHDIANRFHHDDAARFVCFVARSAQQSTIGPISNISLVGWIKKARVGWGEVR